MVLITQAVRKSVVHRVSTVVFLPLVLRQRTRRNTLKLLNVRCIEYSTFVPIMQGSLPAGRHLEMWQESLGALSQVPAHQMNVARQVAGGKV